MKKMMTLLAMILLVFAGMFSQNELLASAQDEDLDSFQFDSEPIQEESIPYFGLGVGYVGTFMYLNFDELNKHLAANKFFNDKKFEVPVSFRSSRIYGYRYNTKSSHWLLWHGRRNDIARIIKNKR